MTPHDRTTKTATPDEPATASFVEATAQPLADTLARQAGPGGLIYASFIRRAAAAAIDLALVMTIFGFLAEFYDSVAPLAWQQSAWIYVVSFGLVGLIVVAVPTTLLPSAVTPTTFGKRALGVIVVDRNGRPVGWRRSLVRIGVRIASLFIGLAVPVPTFVMNPVVTSPTWLFQGFFAGLMSLGHLPQLVTPRRQTLHDLVAGTFVVLDPQRRPDP